MVLAFDTGASQIKAARCLVVPGDIVAFTAALASFRTGHQRGVALPLNGNLPDDGPARVANIQCRDGCNLVAGPRPALGLPVLVPNDADCFARAEAPLGSGCGHRKVFAVILGSGAGGGLAKAPALIAALDRAPRARILQRMDKPLVVVAQVYVDAGLIGAAAAGEVEFAA